MSWLFAVLAVAAMGVVAVVATGRGGSMAPVEADRPDVLAPGDRPLGPGDLRAVRFTTALRGYRMAEVDALLARLAAELESGRGSQPLDPEPPPSSEPTAEGAEEDGDDERRGP